MPRSSQSTCAGQRGCWQDVASKSKRQALFGKFMQALQELEGKECGRVRVEFHALLESDCLVEVISTSICTRPFTSPCCSKHYRM